MSRQREWQLRKTAKGLCRACGQKAATRENGKQYVHCLKHLVEARERSRAKLKCKTRYETGSYDLERLAKPRSRNQKKK